MQENQAPEPPRPQVVELIDKLAAELATEHGQHQFKNYWNAVRGARIPREKQLQAMVDELPKEPSQFLTHLNALYRELRQQVQPRPEELIHESLQRNGISDRHARKEFTKRLNIVLRNAHLVPVITPDGSKDTYQASFCPEDWRIKLQSRKPIEGKYQVFGNVKNFPPISLAESSQLQEPEQSR